MLFRSNQIGQTLGEGGTGVAGWEEAASGKIGIGKNAILFSWTGQGPGLKAARAGYRVVMTPAQHLYLDMAQTHDTDDWGASWAAIVSLSDTIAWDPVPDAEPELEDRILGVQSTFWGEFTTIDEELEPMIAPQAPQYSSTRLLSRCMDHSPQAGQGGRPRSLGATLGPVRRFFLRGTNQPFFGFRTFGMGST